MAVGDFQDYSDPSKNNFTRTFGLSKPRYVSKKTSLGGNSTPLQGGGFDYTGKALGYSGLDGFKDMNSYAQNDALYNIGQQGSYTPAQLDQLTKLDTSGLTTTPTNSSQWIDGLSNYETMQGAAGLGGLAMNAYGMFGSGGTMDVNKKNIELMDQQLLNNREELANRKGYRADIARTFGPKTGLGV